MSRWTKEEIYRRIAGGESPVDMGRAGGRARARTRRNKVSSFKRMAARYSDDEIRNMPWNKD